MKNRHTKEDRRFQDCFTPMPFIGRFSPPECFYDSNDAKLCASVFSSKNPTMLVCPCVVECFVIMNLSGLVLCNDCSFSESRGEIPVKGGGIVCHTPKIPFWVVNSFH